MGISIKANEKKIEEGRRVMRVTDTKSRVSKNNNSMWIVELVDETGATGSIVFALTEKAMFRLHNFAKALGFTDDECDNFEPEMFKGKIFRGLCTYENDFLRVAEIERATPEEFAAVSEDGLPF